MNFIFISPNFPRSYWNFCDRLRRNGVNVLGIGDEPFDTLSPALKNCLTEYYKVGSLANYEEMFRAVAFFSFHYGKIDWIESNNEYWLAQDARLRTDFHITTGVQADEIANFQSKSRMKAAYRKAGVPVARWHMVTRSKKAALAFIAEVGWPVIVKPDSGCGAEATWKLKSEADLDAFYARRPQQPYIMEEFVPGGIVSFDGVAGPDCVPLFCTSNEFPTPILDIVAANDELAYWTVPQIDDRLRDAGFRTIRAFGARNRFFHCEFFRLSRAKKGLGKKGDYVALEVNMRPAGGYTPDMINYANSVDCYQIWADMVTKGAVSPAAAAPHYFCAYAGRRDGRAYQHSHEQILEKYRGSIVMAERMPAALAPDMGNQMYTARLADEAEKNAFLRYVLQPAAPKAPKPAEAQPAPAPVQAPAASPAKVEPEKSAVPAEPAASAPAAEPARAGHPGTTAGKDANA